MNAAERRKHHPHKKIEPAHLCAGS